MARLGVLKGAVRIEAASEDARSAGLVAEIIANEEPGGALLTFSDGRSVALPASLVEVVRASADELAHGQSITVLPAETILSPAEAAQVLGLSRPFVARLLDAGEIDSERLPGSRHRRVRLAEVLAFNERREARREGRRRIGQALADADLPY
jgi:excisionase family DNA binding protein